MPLDGQIAWPLGAQQLASNWPRRGDWRTAPCSSMALEGAIRLQQKRQHCGIAQGLDEQPLTPLTALRALDHIVARHNTSACEHTPVQNPAAQKARTWVRSYLEPASSSQAKGAAPTAPAGGVASALRRAAGVSAPATSRPQRPQGSDSQCLASSRTQWPSPPSACSQRKPWAAFIKAPPREKRRKAPTTAAPSSAAPASQGAAATTAVPATSAAADATVSIAVKRGKRKVKKAGGASHIAAPASTLSAAATATAAGPTTAPIPAVAAAALATAPTHATAAGSAHPNTSERATATATTQATAAGTAAPDPLESEDATEVMAELMRAMFGEEALQRLREEVKAMVEAAPPGMPSQAARKGGSGNHA